MIDYHAHSVVLAQLRAAVAAAPFTDAQQVAARQQTTADLLMASDYATLGALTDHLFAHAVSDGSEVALLDQAANLWDRGLNLFQQLATIRGDLEQALEDPTSPASVTQFNSASFNVQLLSQQAHSIQAEVTLLRDDTRKLAHIAPHPRQRDEPAKTWDWANLLLARRTDAFVRALTKRAHNSTTRAFAFGALSGYAANAAGSAYLNQAVGGPRRSHRFRERLARNSAGSWIAIKFPATPGPGALAQQIGFGGPLVPKLPKAIEQLLSDAVADTFDLTRTPPMPDLQAGYRRMLQHLQLLDRFDLPAPPAPPSGVWPARLYENPLSPPPSLRPQDIGLTGEEGGGVALGSNTPGSSSPNNSDSSGASTICGLIMLILIIIDVVQAFVQCIVQWANDETCTFWDNMLLKKLWEKDPPDPRDPSGPTNTVATAAGLTAIASGEHAMQLVACLFDIHCQIWEVLDRARHFLALHGLIYPGALVERPVYRQFTAMPPSSPWPRRPVADPAGTYHLYPSSSPIEQPQSQSLPFNAGATPDAFIPFALHRIAMPLWQQLARGDQDSQNLDLDADRGFLHTCWATDNSINDNPITVQLLAYNEQ